MSGRVGLLDTSVVIAREVDRRVDVDLLPDQTAISVITLAELHAGVLVASDTTTHARRMATLEAVAIIEALPITAQVAQQWAALRTRLAEEGRSAKINDLWIAAVAMTDGMDVVTQDADFDVLETVGGPTVIRV